MNDARSSWFQRILLLGIGLPVFHRVFELMIFAALLECGAGSVHAINERVVSAYSRHRGRELPSAARFLIAGIVLIGSMVLANRFGLVTLISRGYRALSVVVILSYVVPLLTFGIWSLRTGRPVRYTHRRKAIW